MLSPHQLASRYAFDFRVVRRMCDTVLDAEAFRSVADLSRGGPEIVDEGHGGLATCYRVKFHVPTLIGPGRFAPETVIGFNLAVGDYPYAAPVSWVISDHVPYSPHFRSGAPVCIGEVWSQSRGRMLLGQLLVHVARLLNWDEVARGGGYRGWNGAAIDYHAAVFGDRPLDPSIRYPNLPLDLTHGIDASDELFRSVSETVVGDDGAFFRAAP